MERLKVIFEVRRKNEIVNTFENEKTNLIKLLSYMSGKALKGNKCYYTIKVIKIFKHNEKDLGNIDITFTTENEKDLVYRWYNVPLDSYGAINDTDIIEILGI